MHNVEALCEEWDGKLHARSRKSSSRGRVRPIPLRMETVKDVPAPSPLAAITFAPPAPSTAPSALTAPAPTATAALDQLTSTIVGARGAVLASIDGFAIAKSADMPTEPAHAAMLAATIGLARQLVAMGGGNSLRQVVVDHDGGLLLVWPIGTHRVLAVLADSRVDQRALRGLVQNNVGVLADRPAATGSIRANLTPVSTSGGVR